MSENKNRLKAVFQNVLASPEFDEDAIRRYFSADYRQSVDGKELGFEDFLQHIRVLKQVSKSISYRFKTLAEEGDVVFSNHVVRVETVEGRTAEAQVIAEFRFCEGKLVACDELTRMISGDAADRDLGSRH